MADRNKPEMSEKARKNSENQRKRSSSEFRNVEVEVGNVEVKVGNVEVEVGNVEVEVGNVEVLEDPFENAAAAPPCSRNNSTTPSDEKSFREKLKRAAFLNYGCEVEELSAETFQKLLHTVTAEVRDVKTMFLLTSHRTEYVHDKLCCSFCWLA